jgi:hypothetical protein
MQPAPIPLDRKTDGNPASASLLIGNKGTEPRGRVRTAIQVDRDRSSVSRGRVARRSSARVRSGHSAFLIIVTYCRTPRLHRRPTPNLHAGQSSSKSVVCVSIGAPPGPHPRGTACARNQGVAKVTQGNPDVGEGAGRGPGQRITLAGAADGIGAVVGLNRPPQVFVIALCRS